MAVPSVVLELLRVSDGGEASALDACALSTEALGRLADSGNCLVRLIDAGAGECIEVVLADAESLHCQGGGGTGSHVWTGSLQLARWIFQHRAVVEGRRVMELGCGTALPTLVAVQCGAAEALATDYIPKILECVHQSATASRIPAGRLRTACLDFVSAKGLLSNAQAKPTLTGLGAGDGEGEDEGKGGKAGIGGSGAARENWDIIFFADCIYSTDMGRGLARTLASLLGPGGASLAVGVLPTCGLREGLEEFHSTLSSLSAAPTKLVVRERQPLSHEHLGIPNCLSSSGALFGHELLVIAPVVDESDCEDEQLSDDQAAALEEMLDF